MSLFSLFFGCGESEPEVWASEAGPWKTAQVERRERGSQVDTRTASLNRRAGHLRHELVLSDGSREVRIPLSAASDTEKAYEAEDAKRWSGRFGADGASIALSTDGTTWTAAYLGGEEPFWCPHVEFGSAEDPWAGAPELRTVMLEILGSSTALGQDKGHAPVQWRPDGKPDHADRAAATLFLREFRAAVVWAGDHAGDAEVRSAIAAALGTPGHQLDDTAIVEVASKMTGGSAFVKAIGTHLAGPHRRLAIQVLAAAPDTGPQLATVLTAAIDAKAWDLVALFAWANAHKMEGGEAVPTGVQALQAVARLDPHEGRAVRRAIRYAVKGLFHAKVDLAPLAAGECTVWKVAKTGELTPHPSPFALTTWTSKVGALGALETQAGWHSAACQAKAALGR